MADRKMTIKGSAMADSESIIPRDYVDWLASLKSRISGARQRATIAVNQELVRLITTSAPRFWSGRPVRAGEPK